MEMMLIVFMNHEVFLMGLLHSSFSIFVHTIALSGVFDFWRGERVRCHILELAIHMEFILSIFLLTLIEETDVAISST
jgi:hypothetical protein